MNVPTSWSTFAFCCGFPGTFIKSLPALRRRSCCRSVTLPFRCFVMPHRFVVSCQPLRCLRAVSSSDVALVVKGRRGEWSQKGPNRMLWRPPRYQILTMGPRLTPLKDSSTRREWYIARSSACRSTGATYSTPGWPAAELSLYPLLVRGLFMAMTGFWRDFRAQGEARSNAICT